VLEAGIDGDVRRLGVGDGVADQLAQHARQCRPLHDAQLEVTVVGEGPAEFAVGGGQALRDVRLPLGHRMRQAVAGCGQSASQRLQILQCVAKVVFHLARRCLVHQRQKPRADVVMQVLCDAHALFAATALDRRVEGHRASELVENLVGKSSVVVGE